jgi:hypothetical protein
MRRDRLWLCLAPAVLCLLDKGLTLWGQPAEYWAGDYARHDEANPVTAWFLGWHPAGLAASFALWVAVFGGLVAVLPARPARVVALAVTMGHATGAGTWLELVFRWYGAYPALFLASAALIVLSWERAAEAPVPPTGKGPDSPEAPAG